MFSFYLDQKYNDSVWSCEGIENWECPRKTDLSRLEGKICFRFCFSAMYAEKKLKALLWFWSLGKKKQKYIYSCSDFQSPTLLHFLF